MKKVINGIILVITISLINITSAFAGKDLGMGVWVQDGKEWKYRLNGEFIVNDFLKIDKDWYYFLPDGILNHGGMYHIGDKFYLYIDSGVAYPSLDSHRQPNIVDILGVKCTIGEKGELIGLPEDFNDEMVLSYNQQLEAERIAREQAAEQRKAAIDASRQTSNTQNTVRSQNVNKYLITSSSIKTTQVSYKDESDNQYTIAVTIPFPNIYGANAQKINEAIQSKTFIAARNALQAKKYTDNKVKFDKVDIVAQTEDTLSLIYTQNNGSVAMVFHINLSNYSITSE